MGDEVVFGGDEVVSGVSGDALSSENLKAVVTSVKNFRWIMPWAPERFPSRDSMGDEVVSLFLRTWTLSSENLKSVVTSVKNFRWIMPWDPRRFPRRPPMANSSQPNHIILLLVLTCEGGLIVGMDMSLWYIFGSIPPISIIIGIMILLGITTYFYTIAHFMRAAYDIGGKDVLLGLVIYVTYSAPEVPEHGKKDLEQLPC
ncbi:hypothetical protein KY285_037855 [Solanum tuberosum]|nr:hypothetical protein KY285_037855 [Solanum tuberosum]